MKIEPRISLAEFNYQLQGGELVSNDKRRSVTFQLGPRHNVLAPNAIEEEKSLNESSDLSQDYEGD